MMGPMTFVQNEYQAAPGRYGAVRIEGDRIEDVREKPRVEGDAASYVHPEGGWINGGFFVLEPGAIGYVDATEPMFEDAPLRRLAADGQLTAYRHDGYWQCMDTYRDKRELEAAWDGGAPPWRVWGDR